MSLQALYMSLSNLCGARCLICPHKIRGGQNKGNMSFEVAKRCVDEAVEYGVRDIILGLNGDALINKDFLKVLRYIKSNSNCLVTIYTNFQHLTPDLSKIVIDEMLLDCVVSNIDGKDAESYERMKGLNYKTITTNLSEFLRMRQGRLKVPDYILEIITYHYYKHCIFKSFGKVPDWLNLDIPDDYDEIVAQWWPKMNPQDQILKPFIVGWAMRDLCSGDASRFDCPRFSSLQREAYIASNGDYYACCMMEGQDIVFGNIMVQSLKEIYESNKRKVFLERLKAHEYDKIGFPCTTVQACQEIRLDERCPRCGYKAVLVDSDAENDYYQCMRDCYTWEKKKGGSV